MLLLRRDVPFIPTLTDLYDSLSDDLQEDRLRRVEGESLGEYPLRSRLIES
jgi:hypothetical protein